MRRLVVGGAVAGLLALVLGRVDAAVQNEPDRDGARSAHQDARFGRGRFSAKPRTLVRGPGQGIIQRMTNELGLSDDQVATIRDLDTERKQRLRTAGNDHAKRHEVAQWYRSGVEKVLTEDQRERYRRMSDRGGRGGPRRTGARRGFVAQYGRLLELTEEQKAKIEALAPVFRQKMTEAGADAAKRRDAWQWYQRGIRGVLTEAQKKKYDEQVQRLRAGLRARGLLRVEWALRDLNLTDAQRTRIGALRADREKKVKAAFDEFKEGLKSVLTPEQIVTFEDRLKQRPTVRRVRSHGKPGT